jgi:hypothetical protein
LINETVGNALKLSLIWVEKIPIQIIHKYGINFVRFLYCFNFETTFISYTTTKLIEIVTEGFLLFVFVNVCLFVCFERTNNFSAIWRLSPLPVTGLQI